MSVEELIEELEWAAIEHDVQCDGSDLQWRDEARARLEIARQEIRNEIAVMRAREARLIHALRSLHDVQNGPPLIKYEAEWREAMQLAKKALAESEPLVEVSEP